MILYLEQRLRMCFNTIEWDEKKVLDAKLKSADKSASDVDRKVAADYLRKQVDRLRDASPVTQAVNDDLRQILDDSYKKHLDRGETWKFLGSTQHAWVDGYRKYVRDVVEAFRDRIAKWPDLTDKQDVSDDVKIAWRECWCKAKLVLETQEIPTEPEHMPFMCVTFWKALSKQLKRVSNALLEVSVLRPIYRSSVIDGPLRCRPGSVRWYTARRSSEGVGGDSGPLRRIC